MSALPVANAETNTTSIFQHHGRDLELVPGKPVLAYALKKGPAPYFPSAPQPEGSEQRGRPSNGWGTPNFVHGSEDLEGGEDDEGWGEPISRHGGDGGEVEVDTAGQDPSQPFEWGHIDEQGNAHGCIDIVWTLDGVPSWDGVKYNTLSENSKRLMEAVAALNAGVRPQNLGAVGGSNPAARMFLRE